MPPHDDYNMWGVPTPEEAKMHTHQNEERLYGNLVRDALPGMQAGEKGVFFKPSEQEPFLNRVGNALSSMNPLAYQQDQQAILRPLSISRLDQLNTVHNQNQSRLGDVQSYIGGLLAEGEMYQKECTRLAGELERHKVDRIKERAQYLMKMMWGTDSTLRNMLFVKWRNLVDHTKKDKMFHQEKTTLERLHGDELERKDDLHANELQRRDSWHQEEHARKDYAHANEIDEHVRRHSELKDLHADELQRKDRFHADEHARKDFARAREIEEHQQRQSELKDDHQRQVYNLRDNHAKEIAQHHGMREEVFAKHAAEIIKRKAEHAAAVARHQREVEAHHYTRTQLEKQVAEWEQKFDEKVQNMKEIHDAKLTALARKKDHENDQLRANHEALDKIIGGMENQAKVFTDLSQKARQTYQSGGADANPYSQKDDSKGRWSLVMVPPEGPENNSDQREFLKEHLHYLLACTDTRYLPRLSDKAEEMGGSGSLGTTTGFVSRGRFQTREPQTAAAAPSLPPPTVKPRSFQA